ncbi:MAG: PilZ domain-containing protein [Verrucomicrobia bacterium]|nr:PilZ domain-containing protein [Verrucomicrobiota bacterium]
MSAMTSSGPPVLNPRAPPERERRRHRRLPFERPVAVRVVHCASNPSLVNTRLAGATQNVSTAGMEILCARPLPEDAVIHLRLARPETGAVFRLAAKVVRCTPGRAAGSFALGVELQEHFRRRTNQWARLVFDAVRELNDPA